MSAACTTPYSWILKVPTSFATAVASVGDGLPASSGPAFFCTTPGLLPALPHPASRKSSTIPVDTGQWYHRLDMLVLLICYYFSKPSRRRAGRGTPAG